MDEIKIDLKFYAIRSKGGQWLRAKGYGGSGNNWVDDVIDAKLYLKLGTARRQISFWGSNYPDFGVPDLIELQCEKGIIIDETDRVNKLIEKKKKAKINRDINQKKWAVESAKRELERAKENLKKLTK